MIDRAGQVWDLGGGLVILVLRSRSEVYSCPSLVHECLVLGGYDEMTWTNVHEGSNWDENREFRERLA